MSDYFLADDLSGALDAAAAFHRAGRVVRVPLDPADWVGTAPGEVTGVSTETRNLPPAEAATAVATVIARGRDLGARLVYKKIDSTLRGPVAAELEAVRRALPETRLLFAPANPAVGRTVCDGVLLVHGRPVHETDFGHDPVSPVRESRLRALLAGLPAGLIDIPDTLATADLERAVTDQMNRGGSWVAVGSGALARPVAAALAAENASQVTPIASRAPAPGPVLFLGGSAHALNRRQAARLWSARDVPLHELNLADAVEVFAAKVAASLRDRKAAAVLVAPERGNSALIRDRLTAVATEALAATGTARVFATGGETARALCVALGVRILRFDAELEPGLAAARGDGASGPFLFAVKPGGFGDDDTWLRADDHLRGPA
ncbi:MAG: four-carbon acid sugar kinase family protein [Opitutaceae bacterium]